MTIVLGTDFSARAGLAARAAAALAKRLGDELVLAHVADPPRALRGQAAARQREADERELDRRRALAEAEAERLGALGIRPQVRLLQGTPEVELVALAAQLGARLLVVGSLGRRSPSAWRHGGTADRIAQSASVPVLFARDPEPFEAWAGGARPLRALVGIGVDRTSEAALRWVASLREAGRCDVLRAHVYGPLEAMARSHGALDADGAPLASGIEAAIVQELAARFGSLPGEGASSTRVIAGSGRVADHLVALALDERADLIVVGSSQRRGIALHWHGSVSYRVLPLAHTNVACIPSAANGARAGTPRWRVIAATDFSELGDRAVPYAFSVAAPGGEVVLLHVLVWPGTPGSAIPMRSPRHGGEASRASASEREARERLLSLVPPEAERNGVSWHAVVVVGERVAESICQAAERFACDAICVGSHGRAGVVALVLGSVAVDVLRQARQPVLVVGPNVAGETAAHPPPAATRAGGAPGSGQA